jgi:hypothetical protein
MTPGGPVPPGDEAGDEADDPRGPERRRRDRDSVVAAFAAVLYLALVVCAFGFVSLLADLDVVSRADTGGLVGPTMVATAVAVVLALLIRDAQRAAGPSARPTAWPLLVGLAAAAGFVGIGAVLVAVESRSWFDGVALASSTLASPFPWIAGTLAAAVAGAFLLVSGPAAGSRPRWPWESDEGAGDDPTV